MGGVRLGLVGILGDMGCDAALGFFRFFAPLVCSFGCSYGLASMPFFLRGRPGASRALSYFEKRKVTKRFLPASVWLSRLCKGSSPAGPRVVCTLKSAKYQTLFTRFGVAVATLVKSIASGAAVRARPCAHTALRDVLSLHPLSLNLPKALRGRGTATRLVLIHVAF